MTGPGTPFFSLGGRCFGSAVLLQPVARLATLLVFALALTGCYGLIPPEPVTPAAIPLPPVDRRPVPIRFGSLQTDIRFATPLDGGLISPFCAQASESVWGDLTGGVLKDRSRRVFYRVMSDAGFDVGGDPAMLFQEEQEADDARAVLVVSARLTDIRPVFCQRGASLLGLLGSGPEATLGEVDLRVTWAVFSRLERRALFRTETFGRATSAKPRFSGALLLIEEAFADAAERLAADPGFRTVVFARHPMAPLLTGPGSRDLIGRDEPDPAPTAGLRRTDRGFGAGVGTGGLGTSGPETHGPETHGQGTSDAGAMRPDRLQPDHLRLALPRQPLRTQPLTDGAEPVLRAAVMIESGSGHGSGFYIAPAITEGGGSGNGYGTGNGPGALVLTNAHVVGDAEQVRVTPYDGGARLGTVIRRNLSRDVALVWVEGPAPAVLPVRTAPAVVGEPVFAIGAPLVRQRHHTMTSGIVSLLSRQRQTGLPLVQSDVTVHPGNSGGPLVDHFGNVIAIAVSGVVISGADIGVGVGVGINEFIPITDALRRLALTLDGPRDRRSDGRHAAHSGGDRADTGQGAHAGTGRERNGTDNDHAGMDAHAMPEAEDTPWPAD